MWTRMVKDNEGHGFLQRKENRFDFYRAMEKFLANNPKGRRTAGAGSCRRATADKPNHNQPQAYYHTVFLK